MSRMSRISVDTRVSVVSHVGVHIYMSVLWVWFTDVSVRDVLCESYVTVSVVSHVGVVVNYGEREGCVS